MVRAFRARWRFSDWATEPPGKLTEAALPTWRASQFIWCCSYFHRLHGHVPRRSNLCNNAEAALSADFWFATGPFIVETAGEITTADRGQLRRGRKMATPLSRCLLLLDVRALVLFCLLGDVRRGTTQRRRCRRNASLNFFAVVPLVRTSDRCRRGHDRGDSAETATSLYCCAGIVSRGSRMKTPTRYASEAAAARRRLVGLFCACFCFFLPAVHSAKQITGLGRLTLVWFLRRRWCLLCATGRFRRSENEGRFARTAWLPNHIATTDLRAA